MMFENMTSIDSSCSMLETTGLSTEQAMFVFLLGLYKSFF